MYIQPKQDQWQSYANRFAEYFIGATCCVKVDHLALNHGTRAMVKTPKLLKCHRIKGDYEQCGVKQKLDIMKFPILSECEIEIDVLEWVYAKHQGNTKGKKILN